MIAKCCAVLAVVLLAWPALADTPPRADTRHTVTLYGRRVDYRAVAETIALQDQKGATTASVYVVSYLVDPPAGQQRPVAFVFNGGPGAASVFLHLGALGPRILQTPGDGSVPEPPYRVVDNPHSWLGFTDLVFVDPVGTGFSEAIPGGSGDDHSHPGKSFWNVRSDLTSLSTVVRLWLNRHERWPSPVYLVGESYGGYRVAALSQSLAEEVGVTVNGVVMISPALDVELLHPDIAGLMPAAFAVPSYAATAAALDGKPLQPDRRAEVEAFALGDYVSGLVRMTGVPPAGDPFVSKVAKTIGLDEDTVRRARARVSNATFVRELRRDQLEMLSIYDGTVKRATLGNAWDDHAGDPVLTPATAAFTAAFDAYVRSELGFKTDAPYRTLSHEVNGAWSWDGTQRGEGGLGIALSQLEQALLSHPQTKVLIANGRTDLQTPYLATRWLIDQLSLPPAVRQAIQLKVYDGGHMMYLRSDSLAALARDAAVLFTTH